MVCLFTYFVDDSNQAYIFSALNNKCSIDDFALALSQGIITQQFHDALVANVYGGEIQPRADYWLQLT